MSRRQVLEAAATGQDLTSIAAQKAVAPGLVFMLATGIPADGSGVPELPSLPGAQLPSSPQRLVNDKMHNPLRNDEVEAWVRRRAKRELSS